jgi:hypothetical protein
LYLLLFLCYFSIKKKYYKEKVLLNLFWYPAFKAEI